LAVDLLRALGLFPSRVIRRVDGGDLCSRRAVGGWQPLVAEDIIVEDLDRRESHSLLGHVSQRLMSEGSVVGR
jgi:hypothetical protein